MAKPWTLRKLTAAPPLDIWARVCVCVCRSSCAATAWMFGQMTVWLASSRAEQHSDRNHTLYLIWLAFKWSNLSLRCISGHISNSVLLWVRTHTHKCVWFCLCMDLSDLPAFLFTVYACLWLSKCHMFVCLGVSEDSHRAAWRQL